MKTCLTSTIFLLLSASDDFSVEEDKEYFIALTYNATNSRYQWNDDLALTPSEAYWRSGHNDTSDLCVAMDPGHDWEWESLDCTDTEYFLCEYGLSELC